MSQEVTKQLGSRPYGVESSSTGPLPKTRREVQKGDQRDGLLLLMAFYFLPAVNQCECSYLHSLLDMLICDLYGRNGFM